MTDNSEYNKVINVPYTIIIASFIIIIVTTNMTDVNGLSALLGGYSGFMIGMLFVIILNLVYTKTNWIDMLPSIIILTIVLLLIIYLSIYFDKIAKGEVSSYYSSFSILSSIFLFAQVIIIFLAIFNKQQEQNGRLFTNTTFSILGLLGMINLLIVITIGIILKFYSTQG